MYATLQRWTTDPSARAPAGVEGSRPRLPWGLQLKSLIADPSPTLPLLRALQDDDSEYVRRSVANHLNDIAKDHPDLVVQWPGRTPARRTGSAPAAAEACQPHADQAGTSSGDEGLGLGQALRGTLQFSVTPKRVRIGDSLTLQLTLQSTSARAQALQIDYAVHHVKASGASSPKVFKGWSLNLAPRQTLQLSKRHSMRVVTTRSYHPGRHEVDVRVNGQVLAQAAFLLSA